VVLTAGGWRDGNHRFELPDSSILTETELLILQAFPSIESGLLDLESFDLPIDPDK